jgi:hypothetical protein
LYLKRLIVGGEIEAELSICLTSVFTLLSKLLFITVIMRD